MKIKYNLFSVAMVCLSVFPSCESLLDIDPPTDAMTDEQVYSTEESIEIAATGLYTNNFLNNALYFQQLELYLGFTSDELLYTRTDLAEYYQNSYSPISSYFSNLWTLPYKTIYQCNDFILNVENSTVLSDAKKKLFLSEARFFRAYSYFLLVNCFGDVPLVLTNNYKEASVLARTSQSEVYDQIIDDLLEAEAGLKDSGNEKTRITSEAASALLARVYLYTEQWQQAADKAQELIPASDGGSGDGFQLEEVDRVFKSSSSESILHINMTGYAGAGTYAGYTRIGAVFIPTSNRTNYYLCDELVQDIQENPDDLRNHWISFVKSGSTIAYYPYKYKNYRTPSSADEYEYMVLLRLAEQYLIRAEARTHLNNYAGAVADINKIRARAGVALMETASNQDELLLVIEKERRKEFFFECGHRWFDLNRTKRADAVYGATSYKQWESYKALFPIPENEIGRNTNLVQNVGY